MKTAAGTLIVIAQLFVALPSAVAGEGGIPSVVIPASARAPKIDGRIEAAEWADAAAITGFIQPQSGLVTPPGGVVYIKHDAEKLYFAFRSNLLPGQEPSRRYRRRDEPVYMDSNQIELWLTAPVDDAKTWAYQFIGNAYGAIFDNLQHPELGSVSMGWNGRWTFKNTYEVGKHWDAELSIAAADLGVKRIEAGQVWRGMVGIAWPQRAWPYTGGWYKNLKMHAKWIMGRDAACARIENVDALLDNRLDLRLTAAGNFTAAASVGALKRSHTGRDRCVIRADLPKSDKPRVLRLTVKARDGRTLFDGDWKFTAGVKPKPRKPRPREKPFPAQVSYAAEAKALLARADVLDYPRRGRLAAVTVRVHAKNAPDQPIAEKTITDFRHDQAETYLWLGGKVKPGEYTVRFTFADAKGKTLDANTKNFKAIDPAKEFVWYGNRVGTAYTVKPEFTPIEVDGRHLRVWGRDYAFDSGVLPSQITSKGKEMLARPISLVVDRSDKTVIAEPIAGVRITERSPTRVRFEGAYRADDLRLTLSGYLDFDGMLYYTLRTAATAKVDRVYLSMALKGERARYYHTTAGGWSGAMDAVPTAAADKPFWTSRRFAPFLPYVGLSDDDRCLQWFADNDHNWVHGADRPCVELWRRQDSAELRVNLVRRRGAVPAMKDVHFGFIATPVKPLPAGWRNLSLHFGALNDSKTAFFWGSGHGGGLNLHDSAGLLKKLGVAVPKGKNPDAVLAGLSADVKGVADKLSSKPGGVIACPFHNARMYFPGYKSKAFQTFFPGDWREYPPGGWFHLAPTRSYQDFYCWYFEKWVKHLGVRGVYYDEAYFPRDYNVFNGSGKVMPDGTVRPSVNLMHLRRYMRRVRQIFVDHGVRPFIWVHTSNYMAPQTLSWTQVAMFGEDRSPTPSSDYLDVAPAMIFRSIGRSQKFGIPPIWMNQVGRGGGAGPMTWLGRQVCGWCWMHDTSVELHTSPRGRPLQQLRVLWGIAADDVTYHPYWKQRMVRTNDADFIVSVWRRPKTALLQVFNLSKDKRKTQARLTFDAAALGLGEKFRVFDLESAPKLAEWKPRLAKYDAGQLAAKDLRGIGKLGNADFDLSKLTAVGATVRIPPRDFVLLMVRPASGGSR